MTASGAEQDGQEMTVAMRFLAWTPLNYHRGGDAAIRSTLAVVVDFPILHVAWLYVTKSVLALPRGCSADDFIVSTSTYFV